MFSLPPAVAIVEVEDEVPIERMDAAVLEDVAVEEVAPLVFVVAGPKKLIIFGWCILLDFAIVSEYRVT